MDTVSDERELEEYSSLDPKTLTKLFILALIKPMKEEIIYILLERYKEMMYL